MYAAIGIQAWISATPHAFALSVQAEDDLSYANIDEMISSTISECNNSFAAQVPMVAPGLIAPPFCCLRPSARVFLLDRHTPIAHKT